MIELIEVTKYLNSKVVLEKLNLKIFDGETLCILGKSGVGKTVLLKHIIGLLKPHSGKIIVDGVDITKLKERELYKIYKSFSYVFQGAALFDSLNVYENVALPIYEEKGMSQDEIDLKVKKAISLVDLSSALYSYPAELSGGMRKRVSIARAIVTDPKYILYDEPTSGLDPIMADRINELISNLKRNVKATGIVVTHDVKSVMKIADRIVLLSQGKIACETTPQDISRVTNLEMQEFLKTAGF